MDITRKIVNIVLIIVTVFMTVTSGVCIYFKTVGKNKLPSAITSTYATTVVDPQTGEELPTIEANYYSNKNGKGYEVVELLFNCYSGISKQAIYSRGFQLVTANNETKLYQYNRYNDSAFETGHEYEWGDKMLIDIDGDTYAVALDGKYDITYSYVDGAKIARTIGFIGLNFLFEDTNFTKTETKTYNYTFEDLLLKVKEIIKSCSNGTGDGVISLVDLGDFLHIYGVDEDGKIDSEPLGTGTLQNSYFTMTTHFDNRGMVWAKQSIFKSVAGDSDFNISGISDKVDYWRVKTEYNLTEEDFVSRYLVSDSGFYYSLPMDKITELKNFEDLEINIVFNVSNIKDTNVLGFDYYALYGIKVKSLTIKCNTQRDFKLLVGSLKDTGLTEIATENIKIVNVNSGVNV